MTPTVTPRAGALWVWESLYRLPYRWRGDDPMEGFDCSGLVVEGLKSVGVLARDGDWTAAQLAKMFKVVAEAAWQPGCLVFWNRTKPDGIIYIGHVEILWSRLEGGPWLTIGASGGGSATTDDAKASAANAYVKVRPVAQDWKIVVDPFLV